MEWVDYTVVEQRDTNSKDTELCQLFGCQHHGINLVINKRGQVSSTNDQHSIDLGFPQAIDQIVCSCRQEPGVCLFYLRSVTNQVYGWRLYLSDNHSRKRMKLDSSSMDVTQGDYKVIAENIHHIMPYDEVRILLFSSHRVQYYNIETCSRSDSAQFCPNDINITCHEYFEQLDTCLSNFFSLESEDYALLYGTKEGYVYCRALETDPVEDTQILVFEGSEKVVHVELLNIPALSRDLNTLIAIGDRGTIMIYSRASNDPKETGVQFKQFNIQGPLYSIDKAGTDPVYLAVSGIGRISMLKFKFTTDNVELESTYMKSSPYRYQYLRICDLSNHSFDAFCNDGTVKNIRFNPTPVSIANNPTGISALIKDTLAELEFSENTVKSLENKEQELNQKLSSTNRTLYALRSINQKRKLGACNSLESTGFEFQMHPITRSESISNCSLHSTSYLRICIKTSRFLELEDWDLVLNLFPALQTNKKSLRGETKTVAVMGFEIHYENGIERYSFWERNIEIDLESLTLPLEVSATLVMSSVEEGKLPLRFPVAKIKVDDLHYAIPCSPNFMTSIERRGLEEVSSRLMDSYNKQKLHDKTGRYPFARLINSKLSGKESPPKYLFNYRSVHIRCLVNPQLTEESYCSILSNVLGEGRTMDEISSILVSAEQALFILAAYPGCPITIKLLRVSPSIIDLSIQCIYPPALFKTEAALLARLYDNFMRPISSSDKSEVDESEGNQKNAAFLKKMKLLEDSVIDLQEKYQALEDQMDIDSGSNCDNSNNDTSLEEQLKKAVLLLGIHKEEPIGYLEL